MTAPTRDGPAVDCPDCDGYGRVCDACGEPWPDGGRGCVEEGRHVPRDCTTCRGTGEAPPTVTPIYTEVYPVPGAACHYVATGCRCGRPDACERWRKR